MADELYGLPPSDFTGVRNERVKQARSAGDRRLATEIGGLRRPSTSAFAVNLLVRERRELIEELLELAAALRTAQETLSGDQLRSLSSQRHRVVASTVAEARKLAAAHGTHISDAVERELEATVDAALADPSAADAVRSGRLASSLSYAGLGSAPAASEAPAPPKARTKAPTKPAAAKPSRRSQPDDDAERRELERQAEERQAEERRAEQRRRAEEALRTAEAAASGAESELADARAAHEQALADRDGADHRVADLTAQLEQAQADLGARNTEARDRKRLVQRAEQHAIEAHRRVERARSALR